MHDYVHTLTMDCKYTFVGNFSTTMPNVELIVQRFIQQTQLSGGIDIAHYNDKHLLIDL